MKTKNKLIAMVEIAVVLCSVFLVAIPAIAADQTQTMQKASASAITTASEDDSLPLGIYGNANEDDTIDMGDVVYTKLAIFGKKTKTELCDAKYDGRINVLDVIQTKLIILGKEKEITIIDSADRIVTVKKPVERIVVPSARALSIMRSLKLEKNRIVGVDDSIAKEDEFFSEFSGLPSVGTRRPPDYEVILSLNPDLVITWRSSGAIYAEKLPGVPVAGLDCWRPDTFVDEVRKLGYILDKRDEAEEFIDFYEGVLDPIKEKVERIPEEDKPKVYIEWFPTPYKTGGKGSGFHEKIKMAGGNNIFSDVLGYPVVTAEDVLARNPEIIIIDVYPSTYGSTGTSNTGSGDITRLIELRNEIMNRPGFANIAAVKNERVYIVVGDIFGGSRHYVGIAYCAKWFHPDLFEDLDPKTIHQEYLTSFQGLPDDFLDTHGVFVYPPLK